MEKYLLWVCNFKFKMKIVFFNTSVRTLSMRKQISDYKNIHFVTTMLIDWEPNLNLHSSSVMHFVQPVSTLVSCLKNDWRFLQGFFLFSKQHPGWIFFMEKINLEHGSGEVAVEKFQENLSGACFVLDIHLRKKCKAFSISIFTLSSYHMSEKCSCEICWANFQCCLFSPLYWKSTFVFDKQECLVKFYSEMKLLDEKMASLQTCRVKSYYFIKLEFLFYLLKVCLNFST